MEVDDALVRISRNMLGLESNRTFEVNGSEHQIDHFALVHLTAKSPLIATARRFPWLSAPQTPPARKSRLSPEAISNRPECGTETSLTHSPPEFDHSSCGASPTLEEVRVHYVDWARRWV